MQQEIPLTKKMKRWFRMADLFAYPVTLKYKGERYLNPILNLIIGGLIPTLVR